MSHLSPITGGANQGLVSSIAQSASQQANGIAGASPLLQAQAPLQQASGNAGGPLGASPNTAQPDMAQALSMLVSILTDMVAQATGQQPPSAFNSGAAGTGGIAGANTSGYVNPGVDTPGSMPAGNSIFGQALSNPALGLNAPLGLSPMGVNAGQVAPAQDTSPRVAVVDTFADNGSGFNHGQEVATTIQAGGAQTLQFNLAGKAGSNEEKIDASLKDVLAQVQAGADIDVVNLSQFNPSNNADMESIRQTIDQLGALGVPVLVAAGNNGPNARNALGNSANAILVENTVGGAVSAQSGQGDVAFEGRTTSFATAGLSGQLATRLAQGQSLAQILASVSS